MNKTIIVVTFFFNIWGGKLFPQIFFSIQTDCKLAYNYHSNKGVNNIKLPDNTSVSRDFRYNRLTYSSFINLGFQLHIIKNKSIYEFGLQLDRIVESFGVKYLEKDNFGTTINLSGSVITSATNLYNVNFKYNYQLFNKFDNSAHNGIKTKLFVFAGVDIVTPWTPSVQTGFGGVSFLSFNSRDTISIKPKEYYFRRFGPRLTFGFTLKLLNKNNRSIISLRTYWGSNSFISLGYRDVSYFSNNQLFYYEKSTLSTAGWYFAIIKDFAPQKKSK